MREGTSRGGWGGIVLPSKISIPSPASNVIERPEVREKLSRALARPVTSVVSAAGYGKTAAVSSWVASLSDVPVAWYRIEAEDAPLERFWLHLAAALRMADQRICPSFDEVRLPEDFKGIRPVIDSLILQMEEFGSTFACVLDDFHEAQEHPEVLESVQYLLRHMPGNAHFVIASRRPLLFPTAKMKVVGELAELTEADLRFSFDETRALFASMGVRTTEDEVRLIRSVTQGWAAGDKLVALLCGNGPQTDLDQALAQAQRGMSEYLFQEVFSVLGEDTQRFLVRTSAVESFCLPLAERITGLSRAEVAAQVDFLIDNDLFTERFERKNGEDWYRYHLLLSEVLRERLGRLAPEESAGVKRAARDWYEENGFLDAAVEISAELGDYESVRDVILAHWQQLYMDDSHKTLRQWASAMPEAAITASPLLCAVLAMPAALAGDFMRADALIQAAVGRLHDDQDFLFALCMAQKAYIASFRGDRSGMRAYVDAAMRHLPESEHYLRGMMLQINAATLWYDDPVAARAELARAVRLQVPIGNANLSCSAYCNLAVTCADLGLMGEARMNARNALQLYDEEIRRFKPMLAYAHLALMECAYEENDFERALEERRVALETSIDGVVLVRRAELEALAAKIGYCTKNPRAKEAFFEAMAQSEIGAVSVFPSLPMVKDWCASFRQRAVEKLEEQGGTVPERLFNAMIAYHLDWIGNFEEVCSFAEWAPKEMPSLRVRALSVAAAFSEKVAQFRRAEDYLSEATDLAVAVGLEGAFCENAAYVRPVAERLLACGFEGQNAELLRLGLDDGRNRAPQAALTERELSVMRRIAAGDTVAQAAEALYVSRDTVKKHLSNTYAKLGVHSKMQAVALLREQGVL